jgi:hypothetical protein
MKLTALSILLSFSLFGCAGHQVPPPSAVTTSGNVNRLTQEWKAAQKQNASQSAPEWCKRQYKSSLKTVNELESELKEEKAR